MTTNAQNKLVVKTLLDKDNDDIFHFDYALTEHIKRMGALRKRNVKEVLFHNACAPMDKYALKNALIWSANNFSDEFAELVKSTYRYLQISNEFVDEFSVNFHGTKIEVRIDFYQKLHSDYFVGQCFVTYFVRGDYVNFFNNDMLKNKTRRIVIENENVVNYMTKNNKKHNDILNLAFVMRHVSVSRLFIFFTHALLGKKIKFASVKMGEEENEIKSIYIEKALSTIFSCAKKHLGLTEKKIKGLVNCYYNIKGDYVDELYKYNKQFCISDDDKCFSLIHDRNDDMLYMIYVD